MAVKQVHLQSLLARLSQLMHEFFFVLFLFSLNLTYAHLLCFLVYKRQEFACTSILLQYSLVLLNFDRHSQNVSFAYWLRVSNSLYFSIYWNLKGILLRRVEEGACVFGYWVDQGLNIYIYWEAWLSSNLTLTFERSLWQYLKYCVIKLRYHFEDHTHRGHCGFLFSTATTCFFFERIFL